MNRMNFPNKISIFLLICLTTSLSFASDEAKMEHGKMSMGKVSLEEKLGEEVPLDLTFLDESGGEMSLEKMITRPTVLTLVYLTCSHACPLLLTGLAEVVGKTSLIPGVDYDLLTISFDKNDTPEVASEKKVNYIKAVGKPLPAESWHFFTGTGDNIRALTEAVGFNFKKEEVGFTHPVTLIILSARGKVTRYLTGSRFLPFDLEMAVAEASEGRVGSMMRRAYLYCFSYDPAGKKYAFNLIRVVGIVTILFAISFILFLIVTGRKFRKGPG